MMILYDMTNTGKTISQEEEYNRLRGEVTELSKTFEKKKALFDAKHASQLATMQVSTLISNKSITPIKRHINLNIFHVFHVCLV